LIASLALNGRAAVSCRVSRTLAEFADVRRGSAQAHGAAVPRGDSRDRSRGGPGDDGFAERRRARRAECGAVRADGNDLHSQPRRDQPFSCGVHRLAGRGQRCRSVVPGASPARTPGQTPI